MSLSCAFTGHRKISEDFEKETLRKAIKELLEQGCEIFYCGMAYGFDLLCCEILNSFRKEFSFQIVACIPCQGQEKGFSFEDKILYEKMCEACDKKIILHDRYVIGCMQERDRYMVDRADVVLAYINNYKSGTGYTVNYAKNKGKKIKFLL